MDNNIIKICIHHGALTKDDIYFRPDGAKICRTCKNLSATRRRYLDEPYIGDKRACVRCKTEKLISEFNKFDIILRYPYCTNCRFNAGTSNYHKRKSHLKRRYEFSSQEYDALLLQQNNVCAICKNPETALNGNSKSTLPKLLSVDHNHNTKKVRGLLCHACNITIGSSKESLERLRGAIAYLEFHS